ncbi:hypothetical protein VKT23_000140 [Stygiomarasmius scandens]|uniref:F-box domain-containing protein n=1 Tax=Marasmiellus scandens TaxID=2682957 RepID=A0ABR1K3G9_9AGAR
MLQTLPYDLLLYISLYLDLATINNLHLVCKFLYFSLTTRPVYRKLASDLLRRCRPLPLKGFQRIGDLSTEQFIHIVNKAWGYESAWRRRGPRALGDNFKGEEEGMKWDRNLSIWRPHLCNNYLDLPEQEVRDGLHTTRIHPSWYQIIHTPSTASPSTIHWLSPITSSYLLCSTKFGQVICWDIQRDTCLASWSPPSPSPTPRSSPWELWKCRVDFDSKTVWFVMARVIRSSYNDTRLTTFLLVRLSFTESTSGHAVPGHPPVFDEVMGFTTLGVVMNIFILDPGRGLISAFVWRERTNTIGLVVILEDEYVFVDTGIDCVMSSNWSCILFDENIVIHCEDSDAAFQHFYPLEMLKAYASPRPSSSFTTSSTSASTSTSGTSTPTTHLPTLTFSSPLLPYESLTKQFTFPSRRSLSLNGDKARLNMMDRQRYMQGLLEMLPGRVKNDVLDDDAETEAETEIETETDAYMDTADRDRSSRRRRRRQRMEGSSERPNGKRKTKPQRTRTRRKPERHPNPFPFPPWYPESAHFVRQWWPTLTSASTSQNTSFLSVSSNSNSTPTTPPSPTTSAPSQPRVSCTVLLLASHDPLTHTTKFVLAQHYFCVPLIGGRRIGFREPLPLPPLAPSTTGMTAEVNGETNGQGNGNGTEGGTRRRRREKPPYEMYYLNEHESLAKAKAKTREDGAEGYDSVVERCFGTYGIRYSDSTTAGASSSRGVGVGGASGSEKSRGKGRGNGKARGKGKERAHSSTSYFSSEDEEGDGGPGQVEYSTQSDPGSGSDSDYSGPEDDTESEAEEDSDTDPLKMWYLSDPFEVVCVHDAVDDEHEHDDHHSEGDHEAGEGFVPPPPSASTPTSTSTSTKPATLTPTDDATPESGGETTMTQAANGGEGQNHNAAAADQEDNHNMRPRPLIAVDFGHAVWVEYIYPSSSTVVLTGMNYGHEHDGHGHEWDDGSESEDGGADGEREREGEDEVVNQAIASALNQQEKDEGSESESESASSTSSMPPLVEPYSTRGRRRPRSSVPPDPDPDVKRLRFVTFPPYDGYGSVFIQDHDLSSHPTPRDTGKGKGKMHNRQGNMVGTPVTLPIPPELDLNKVETINLDQSQGAVILSVRDGRVFVVCYE